MGGAKKECAPNQGEENKTKRKGLKEEGVPYPMKSFYGALRHRRATST